MELSLFYFVFTLFTLLSTADPTEFDLQCPLSRRLLSANTLSPASNERKVSHKISPSSKLPPSSPPKYARTSDSGDLAVFIRPQISKLLSHKPHSYANLLKPKRSSNKENLKSKPSQKEQKKQCKKKTQKKQKSAIVIKSQELTSVDKNEQRNKTLVADDSVSKQDKKLKKTKKKSQTDKPISASGIKNDTKPTEKVTTKSSPSTKDSADTNDKKVKPTKVLSTDENKKPKKPLVDKASESKPLTPSVNEKPPKSSSSSAPSSSSPSKPAKNVQLQEDNIETMARVKDETESSSEHHDDTDEKHSVVDRAYHFVKHMFQLSDDILTDNYTEENQMVDTNDEHQQYNSRKLLSINDDKMEIIMNNDIIDDEFGLHSNDETLNPATDDLSFVEASISKRQLLSAKINKYTGTSKSSTQKGKKTDSTTSTNEVKPKVGWAYRYRISRYLEALKMKQASNKNRSMKEGKTKHSQQRQSNTKQTQKKRASSNDRNLSKRKLLEYESDHDSSRHEDDKSNQDTENTVSITETFLPKRHLLMYKQKKNDEENIQADDTDLDTSHTYRRMKSLEESTDPILIVQSYDRGLYKPRVGWQFRYRVSRYINALRENIREDQERLKLGLQAIKRKTPQELSGKRKRVLDKPFTFDSNDLKTQQEQSAKSGQENKPRAGWRYRYRIHKMMEAKKRGDYIDDEHKNAKERLEQRKKPLRHTKAQGDSHTKEDKDLDPELNQISEEGRRVGWAYRYRIRQKLDRLNRQKAETGIPFDLSTLSAKGEKKTVQTKLKSTEKKTTESIDEKSKDKSKSVGWQYRYRVSKMQEAQKHSKSKPIIQRNKEKISTDQKLDSELGQLNPEERKNIGWKYRYRVRRKVDDLKNKTGQNEYGKRITKKPSAKTKTQEKLLDKVEESIEKVLNIEHIDETPFMEYFRRTSSYLLFGLLPAAKTSICLLPLPMTFRFCEKQSTQETLPIKEQVKAVRTKKLKTKKEHRAKQFIRSHVTKLGADDKYTERRVDETMKRLYKTPSLPPLQTPSITKIDRIPNKKSRSRTAKQVKCNEKKKYFNQEHVPEKMIGIDAKESKVKKRSQLIGQEVKIKRKHKHKHKQTSTPSVTTTKYTTTVTSRLNSSTPRLRSISEVIQEEAASLFGGTQKYKDIFDEIDELNEIAQEQSRPRKETNKPPSITIKSTKTNKESHSTSSDNHNTIDEEYARTNPDDTHDLENH